MRTAGPWVAGLVVLVALWPTLCVSSEDGPTRCRSIVLLPLPWGGSADTWGLVVAVTGALAAYAVARLLLRRPRRSESRRRRSTH